MSRIGNIIEIVKEGESKPKVQIELSDGDSFFIRIPRRLLEWVDKKFLGK